MCRRTLTVFLVVETVEKCRDAHDVVDDGGEAAVLWEDVLVLVAPPAAGDGATHGHGVHRPARHPRRQLAQLGLGERAVF